MGAIYSGLAMLTLLVAIAVPVVLWFGWAASIMWAWFIVPTFGVPPLSVVQCAAIMLTLGMFRPRLSLSKSDPDQFWPATGSLILAPPITVALGWAIKNWFL